MGGMSSMAAMGMGGMGGMPGMGMMPMMQMVPMVPMMPMAAMAMGAMNAMNAMSCMPAMAAMANMGAMGSSGSSCDATKRTNALNAGGNANCSSSPANAVQAFSHVDLQERLLKARCAAAEALPSSTRDRSPVYHHKRRREPSPPREPHEPPLPAPPHQQLQHQQRQLQMQQHDATSSRHRDASLLQDSPKTDEGYLGLQPPLPGSAPPCDETDVLAMTGEKPLEAAKKAALEIKATLERKDRDREPEPPVEASMPKPPGGLNMGVVIHWSGIRGFGILRSQAHGEIFVHAKSLVNCTELVVGDVVTFEVGFDRKKQKPEAASSLRPIAVNCLKAGADACRALHTSREDHLRPVLDATWSQEASSIGGARPVDDAMLAGAAAAAAKKLLAQGMGGVASADGEEPRTGSRPRRSFSSSSRSGRQRQRRSSRGRPRRSRSRSRSRSRHATKAPRERR